MFSKMAGGGNDFVFLDNRKDQIADPVDLTRRICTAHLSVGADGLILIEPSARADFRMRYFNNDGSGGEFCANGTRCAARYAVLNGIAAKRMTIETDIGVVGAEVSEGTAVTLSLPSPHGYRAERPLRIGSESGRPGRSDREPRRARRSASAGETPALLVGSSIVMGVPHYVIFFDGDLWSYDVVPLGGAIRHHPDLKPDGGANVNFVSVRGEHSIEVRTYERGVEAETLSCGSGVVASVSVSALSGRVSSPVSVLTRSGITFKVTFTRRGNELHDVRLTGDARLIYRAELTSETIEGFDPDWVRNPTEKVLSAES